MAMFGHSFAKKAESRDARESCIYPILTADELMADDAYQALIKRMRGHARLPDEEVFDRFYWDLLDNFAEFVQSLPHLKQVSSTHFNVALTRSYHLMETVEQHLLKKKNLLAPVQDARVVYAVFSAALLNEIGQIDRDRLITLTDDKGLHVADWHPMAGAMQGASHYRLRYAKNRSESFASVQAVLLARAVMPMEALTWLAQDSDLFVAWHQALHYFEEGFSDFTWSEDLHAAWQQWCHRDEFQVRAAEAQETLELLQAEKFWQWLKDALNKGHLRVNQQGSGIYYSPDGLVLNFDKVFKAFRDVYPQFHDAEQLQRQLARMGILTMADATLQFQENLQAEEAKTRSTLYRKDVKPLVFTCVCIHNIHMFVNPAALPKMLSAEQLRAINPPNVLAKTLGRMLHLLGMSKNIGGSK